MIAENFSASLGGLLSLTNNNSSLPQGYYRSKLFVAPFTINPLVAAAGPILSLLERLGLSPSLPAINNLRENIEHELNAFHSRLKSKAYTEELTGIAHYLLCATLDELVGKNYLRVYGKAPEFCAFTPASMQDEAGPQQRFFDIIDYIKERPHQYLDLLELAYYCLIAGFEGIQYKRTDGRQVLDNLIEELYQLIQQYRVNKSHYLFKPIIPLDTAPKNHKPIIMACLISLSVLLAGYCLSYALLENKAKTVQFGHHIISQLDN